MFFIRQACSEDVADIASIHVKSWHAAYVGLLPESYINNKNSLTEKIKMWQQLIVHPNVNVWIAYDVRHHHLGFIGCFAENNNYEITTLYVLPDYQGLGIGSKLMKTSLQDILDATLNARFYLWVLKTNAAAIRFYKKLGFIENGENSEEYYKDTKIVDIKMVRETKHLT